MIILSYIVRDIVTGRQRPYWNMYNATNLGYDVLTVLNS